MEALGVGRLGALLILVVMMFGVGRPAPAEAGRRAGEPQKAATQMGDEGPPATKVADPLEAMQAKIAMQERHKRLVSDTEKLLQMSMELKGEVDRLSKDEMSLSVIRKAEAIEKLAHQMQGRMKS